MPPRVVLLDLYDTLVDGDWHGWRAQLSTLTGIDEDTLAMAYHLTREERNTGAYPSAEESMRRLLTAAGLEAPSEQLVRTVVDAEEAFGGNVRLYDDSLPTVVALRERGILTALVSNCSHAARPIVEQLGLPALFDAVVLSFEIGVRKPEPGIYEAALAALDGDPADALFVDDQTAYCDGARALGIDTRLIVRDDAQPAEGFAASTNGHTVITDLSSLL
jgi:putative hydrolase of the HAD superfamily